MHVRVLFYSNENSDFFVLWVCVEFIVPLENFHSYRDVTITGERLQILIYARYSWPLSSEGSLMCHTYLVISEDPWHSHLLSSVWHLLQDITFLFMAKFKSNRYWIYVSVKKIAFNLPHGRRTAVEKRKRGEAQRCDLINGFAKKARKWWTVRNRV